MGTPEDGETQVSEWYQKIERDWQKEIERRINDLLDRAQEAVNTVTEYITCAALIGDPFSSSGWRRCSNSAGVGHVEASDGGWNRPESAIALCPAHQAHVEKEMRRRYISEREHEEALRVERAEHSYALEVRDERIEELEARLAKALAALDCDEDEEVTV